MPGARTSRPARPYSGASQCAVIAGLYSPRRRYLDVAPKHWDTMRVCTTTQLPTFRAFTAVHGFVDGEMIET